jgi:lipoprotein-releasing system permease protein
MGIDEKAVVAQTTADQFGLAVGSTIKLHSPRNLQELANKWRISESELVGVEHAEMFAEIREDLRAKMSVEEGRERFDLEDLRKIYNALDMVQQQPIRDAEREHLVAILNLLNSGEPNDADDRRLLPPGSVEKAQDQFDILAAMDRQKENGRYLEGLNEVALPKELVVIGIFKVTTHVVHPRVFVPLPTGQELKNLDGGVESIGVRVADPYKVGPVRDLIAAALPADWTTTTWMQENQEFVSLIAKERMMMYFALSFIMLVSAFCICAVMFTVTIQKKQEIGVMKALGARPGQVVFVFLWQGLIIGFLGALLGVGLGLLVIRFRKPIHELMIAVGFDPFPAGFHYIDDIPAHVNPGEVCAIAAGAFLLCSLASLLPAWFASRRDAARCLRNF